MLKRCVDESDHEVRLLLGDCFGEIGAIGPNKLADLNFDWKPPSQASAKSMKPWEASHTPGFHIVKIHLVNALKAARSTIDQHKIAFAIQQILAILNIEMTDSSTGNKANPDYKAAMTAKKASRHPMNSVLSKKLNDEKLFEVVEPFYHSEFAEVSFQVSFNYFIISCCKIHRLTQVMLRSFRLIFVKLCHSSSGFQIGRGT